MVSVGRRGGGPHEYVLDRAIPVEQHHPRGLALRRQQRVQRLQHRRDAHAHRQHRDRHGQLIDSSELSLAQSHQIYTVDV